MVAKRKARGGKTSRQSAPARFTLDDLSRLQSAAERYRTHDGDKFPGGFGPTDLLAMDYWTLRARSSQLFRTNLYARGIIRRLLTNEINTGLHLESMPAEAILRYPEDGLADWSEEIESRFELWATDPQSCDFVGREGFGQLQAVIRRESLITGDILCVLLQHPGTKMPRLQLISGNAVQTPPGAQVTGRLPNGTRILHGVELDEDGRQVAYWIRKRSAGATVATEYQYTRLPAFGETGRRLAWLVYGVDKRLHDVRGEPLLSIVLQSLNEVDRYRDSVQRKAVINAMLAMFIATGDKPGTRPMTGGAVRRGQETIQDAGGNARTLNFAEFAPGTILDRLAPGEIPHAFQTNSVNEKFGDFETAIIQAVCWAMEIPPEIGQLSFGSNYSASQAAINEFKMYLNVARDWFGAQVTQPIYSEWLLSAVLVQRISAPGLVEAWRDPARREEFSAWVLSDWTGHIKPAVDMSKLVGGYEKMLRLGMITHDRAARELTGTKFSKNVRRLRAEVALLVEANMPLIEAERGPAPAAPPEPGINEEPVDKEPVDDEGDQNALAHSA